MHVKTFLYCFTFGFIATITSSFPVNNGSKIDWLPNSHRIGQGYNPSTGDPACYSGDCVMNGFGASIFKLNYSKIPIGSCTNKIIPEYTEITCIPASEVRETTEKISTFYELKESMSKSSSSGFSLGGMFNFGSSKQSSWMIHNMYTYNYTMYYTYAKLSYVRLNLFEPRLELTDDFRLAIANMPCCHIGCETTEQYIRKAIFDQFGYAYMSEMLLGGVAYQLITINGTDIEQMAAEGIQNEKESGVSFGISFGKKEVETHEKSNHTRFLHYVKHIYASTSGGQPFDNSVESNDSSNSNALDQWFKTVPDNPVITRMTLHPLSDLMTSERFPNDSLIEDKARLIEQVWIKYEANPVHVTCVNNCTSPCHGQCISTGYFQFGQCKCTAGYTGHDCSRSII